MFSEERLIFIEVKKVCAVVVIIMQWSILDANNYLPLFTWSPKPFPIDR